MRLVRIATVATRAEETEVLDALRRGESLEAIAARLNENRAHWRHVLAAVEKILGEEDPYYGLRQEEIDRAAAFAQRIEETVNEH